MDAGMIIVTVWTVFGAFFLFLFAFPALFLTFTRIYLSVTGKLGQQESPAPPASPDL
jgi:heme/copper-type cytochrome/quinol oxidase subunit 1